MNQHYRDTRKIDPTKGDTLGDGSPNDGDRIEIGPTELAHRADQPRLTRREHDMLSGLRAGLSNKEIADKLQLSEVTVKHHVKSLRGKLGARNRVHAICCAIELQIE